MKRRDQRHGGALVVALVTLLVVTLTAGAVVRSLVASSRQARQSQNELQAEWLAESAVARAAAQLARQPDYKGETWQPSIRPAQLAAAEADTGVCEIRVERTSSAENTWQVTVTARYPNHDWRHVSVRREYHLNFKPPAARTAPEEAP